jgi:hypothetical protein
MLAISGETHRPARQFRWRDCHATQKSKYPSLLGVDNPVPPFFAQRVLDADS